MYNDRAVKAYIEIQTEIQTEIEKLKGKVDKHNAEATEINWGHVGDMASLLALLKQLTDEE